MGLDATPYGRGHGVKLRITLFSEGAKEATRVSKKRHTEQQILHALRQTESGTRVADICREHGVSEATYYVWKTKYSRPGLEDCQPTVL